MTAPRHLDASGTVLLVFFAALMGFNQVVIKVVNDGLQPVFFAGLRSAGVVVCLGLWMWFRGLSPRIAPGTWKAGLLIGAFFSAEFIFMFIALDLTSVARSSVLLYSMPVWLALGAHFLLDDKIDALKAAGLAVAFAGVAYAILDRPPLGQGSLVGDLFALAASLCWAAIALCARGTAMVRVRPEMQLMWQVAVSAVVLLIVAPLFGPLLRDPQWIHWAGLGFQIVVVVTFGFLLWLWLLTRYAPASVASFSFLSPIFGAAFGILLLGETLTSGLILALILVCTGLAMINWPRSVTSHKTSR